MTALGIATVCVVAGVLTGLGFSHLGTTVGLFGISAVCLVRFMVGVRRDARTGRSA